MQRRKQGNGYVWYVKHTIQMCAELKYTYVEYQCQVYSQLNISVLANVERSEIEHYEVLTKGSFFIWLWSEYNVSPLLHVGVKRQWNVRDRHFQKYLRGFKCLILIWSVSGMLLILLCLMASWTYKILLKKILEISTKIIMINKSNIHEINYITMKLFTLAICCFLFKLFSLLIADVCKCSNKSDKRSLSNFGKLSPLCRSYKIWISNVTKNMQ